MITIIVITKLKHTPSCPWLILKFQRLLFVNEITGNCNEVQTENLGGIQLNCVTEFKNSKCEFKNADTDDKRALMIYSLLN